MIRRLVRTNNNWYLSKAGPFAGPYVTILFFQHCSILLRLHGKLTELINAFSKARMIAYCDLKWWRKLEYLEKFTTDLGRATTTVPHANTGNRSRAEAVYQNLNQKCLLVTRQNDNHSPGLWPGILVPSSHKRNEFSNTILNTFSRGDKRVWKCIPIPNGLEEKATLINISVSNGNLICHRMIILATPNRKKRSSVGILALPFRPLYNNMSLLLALRYPCHNEESD